MGDINCNLTNLARICGILLGLAIIIMSVFRFMTLGSGNIQQFILTVHFILLGTILILSEFRFNWVLRNFYLIAFTTGRGIFTLFLGTVLLTYPSEIFQFIVALAGIFIGILYIVVGLMEKSQTNFELESSNQNSRAPSIK